MSGGAGEVEVGPLRGSTQLLRNSFAGDAAQALHPWGLLCEQGFSRRPFFSSPFPSGP